MYSASAKNNMEPMNNVEAHRQAAKRKNEDLCEEGETKENTESR